MHRATRRDTLRTIRRSLSRYLSIALIIAIGVAFFAGLTSTGSDMRLTAQSYYSRTHTQDMSVISTLGFSQEDLAHIANLDGVEQVMGSNFVDCLTLSPDNFLTRVYSLPENPWQGNDKYLNRLEMLEGRVPKYGTECVIDANIRDQFGFSLGDTLTLAPAEGKSLDGTLKNTEFTVVGVANSPLYNNMSERGATTVGDGSLDAFIYILEENFLSEFYAQVAITYGPSAAFDCYDAGYLPSVEPLRAELEKLAEGRAVPRMEEMRLYLTDSIADGEAQIADGQQQLDDAKAALEEARQQLADARRELEEGRRELEENEDSARADIAAGWEEIATNRDEYDRAEAQYWEGYRQYEAGLAQWEAENRNFQAAQAQVALLSVSYGTLHERLNLMEALDTATPEGWAQLQYHANAITPDMNRFTDESGASLGLGDMMYDGAPYSTATPERVAAAHRALTEYYTSVTAQIEAGQAQLEAAKATLDASAAELSSARAQLDSAAWQLENGEQELREGEQALDDAQQALTDGEKELSEGEKKFREEEVKALEEIAEGEAELSRARYQLADAKEMLAQLEPVEWYIYDRSEAMPGFSEFSDDADRMDNISAVFPVFFLAVATLVCMTTLARMVEEHRTEIGTFKALGYSDGRIRRKYMVYALSATAVGCLIGLVAGFQIFPTVIITVYCMMYDLPAPLTPFHPLIALGCAAVALLCVGLVCYFVCRKELREQPAIIMRPKAPTAGKRIPLEYVKPLWSRLNFSYKVTVRNLFRYKKRVCMTLIGIAGCAALVLTGYGLQDAIDDIVRCQFDNVFHYDLLAGFSVDTEEERQELYDYMDGHALVAEWMPQSRQTLYAVGTEKEHKINLTVSRDHETLGRYIQMQNRETGEKILPQMEGVVITEKLAILLDLAAGDTLTLRDSNHRAYTVAITGVAENYADHFVYLSAQYYEAVFGAAPEYNSVIMNLTDSGQLQAMKEELLRDTPVQMVSAVADLLETFAGITDNLGAVVAVIIVSAGLLAFVVLYNLSNISITERTREIATLKVLGFYDGEVSAYIYRESIILTVLGTALGLGLGTVLTRFVVSTAEVDTIMFGRNIYAPSFLMAVVLTFTFSFLVNLVMYFRLKKINMVESMKAID